MKRARYIAFLLSSLLTLPLFAQDFRTFGFDQAGGSNTVQTPDELRRVEPPSKTATAEELEVQADTFRFKKSYADALDYYRAAIKKKDTAALENKAGLSELFLFHLKEAEHRFDKAAKLDRTYSEALNNLGVIHYLQHNYRKSIKSYEQALKQSPDNASFHKNLATAYFAKEDYSKAAEQYGLAMQIDPDIFTRESRYAVSAGASSPQDRAKFHFTIAKVFAKQGDNDRCLLYLTKAIEEGFPALNDVYKEAEFAGILKDPRFVTLMASKPEAVK